VRGQPEAVSTHVPTRPKGCPYRDRNQSPSAGLSVPAGWPLFVAERQRGQFWSASTSTRLHEQPRRPLPVATSRAAGTSANCGALSQPWHCSSGAPSGSDNESGRAGPGQRTLGRWRTHDCRRRRRRRICIGSAVHLLRGLCDLRSAHCGARAVRWAETCIRENAGPGGPSPGNSLGLPGLVKLQVFGLDRRDDEPVDDQASLAGGDERG